MAQTVVFMFFCDLDLDLWYKYSCLRRNVYSTFLVVMALISLPIARGPRSNPTMHVISREIHGSNYGKQVGQPRETRMSNPGTPTHRSNLGQNAGQIPGKYTGQNPGEKNRSTPGNTHMSNPGTHPGNILVKPSKLCVIQQLLLYHANSPYM